MRIRNLFFTSAALCLFLISATAAGDAEISSPMDDLDIRILYDNSGSMYPGYRLRQAQSPGGMRKSQLGVGFFHEYPGFRKWLAEMISSQGQINGKNVSITAFTEQKLEEILPPTPREQITQETIAGAFEKLRDASGKFRWGQYTHLAKNLENFVRDFEGIVWLITDNIIDIRKGTRDNKDMLDFFRILNQGGKYRAVHLYKYPFGDTDKNRHSDLAIYGMLISSGKIDTSVVEYFDERFVRLKKLFPEQEHLKLKDLTVNPIDLDAPIKVEVVERKGSLFREKQIVRLHFDGKIRSNLTQHTVAAGTKYRIAVEGPFLPDAKSAKEFGIQGIPSNKFTEITGNLTSAIPPRGNHGLDKVISSKVPVTISVPRGISSFVRSAFGIRVRYAGKVRFSLYNVRVKLERGHLSGIYGIDQASSVFDFQDVQEIYVKPRLIAKNFDLETGGFKGVLLLLLLLLILALFGAAIWFLLRSEQCRIRTDQKTEVIRFRRFGSHTVVHKRKLVGIVRRGFGRDYTFVPSRGTAGLLVKPHSDMGKYDITLRDESFLLLLEPLDQGTVKHEIGERSGQKNRHPTRPEPSSRTNSTTPGRRIKKPRL